MYLFSQNELLYLTLILRASYAFPLDQQSCVRHLNTNCQWNDLNVDESSKFKSFPTSEIQQAYLFGRTGYFELGHVSCFTYQEFDYPSELNVKRVEVAFNSIIQRHETLRTIFLSEAEQKVLDIVPHYEILTVKLDDETSIHEQLIKRRTLLSHQIRPADKWPLFDVQITNYSVDGKCRSRLHIGFDVLILDLWSLNLVNHEFSQLYSDANIILPKLNLTYQGYIVNVKRLESSTIYEGDRKYWIDRVGSFPFGPKLPLRCLPNELEEQRFISLRQVVDRSVWQILRQRIKNAQLTPAGFLVSIFAITIAKWCEVKHFSLNLPIFNRLPIHEQVNQIAGDFTSLILLEIDLCKPISFEKFFKIVQQQLWNDLEHMSYNGVSFIRELMRTNDTTKIVFPIVFTCATNINDTNAKTSSECNDKLFTEPAVYSVTQTPQIYMDSQVHEFEDQLVVEWNIVENLFPSRMIENMQQTFVDLLHRMAFSADIWQKPIMVPLPMEQEERRVPFNQTECKIDAKSNSLHRNIVEQAEKTPEAWAIFSSRRNLTYGELLNRANSLANYLRGQGAESNTLIAIVMKKGWEQVVACLAILITGAAYLPLDIDSPDDRLRSIFEDANVRMILTQSDYQKKFGEILIIAVDTFPANGCSKQIQSSQQNLTDLAYVIYTSGSTGKPKGVGISHHAVTNTICDMNSRITITPKDRVFGLSHLNFDLSVYDIFGALSAGAALVIVDHDNYKNPELWYELMIKHGVTIWNSVPMLMQMLVEQLCMTYSKNNLRHILLSGDRIPLSLPPSIRTTFGEQVAITSLGGATEASIWSIAYPIPKRIPSSWKSIPYGLPLKNQQYYVYDSNLCDCAEWVIGELYIGGIGLANGYWGDEQKTLSSFIYHPETGDRLYRTGDHGRFTPDGFIEFIGRTDSQVKLHGHRIELEEIEHQLQQHEHIEGAIVTIDEKYLRLISYVIVKKTFCEDTDLTSTLQQYLSKKLPAYLVPSLFIRLEKMLLSANGKVDRKALPKPDDVQASSTDNAENIPLSPLEMKLQSIFAKVLNIESPHITRPLGQLGGTSLDAMRILALIRQEINAKVDLIVLLSNPSVGQLARYIEKSSIQQESVSEITSSVIEDAQSRSMPSIAIESLGVLLLIFQWFYPFFRAYQSGFIFAFLLIPPFHLLLYILMTYLLCPSGEKAHEDQQLFSYRYYRWWFLNRLWAINTSFWLRIISGTPLYNQYLRMCGARIGNDAHIYTTVIDAPWLLRVGESAFIGSETIISNLSLYESSYKLCLVDLGSRCSIGTRSVLYDTVTIEDDVHISPMSAVTGNISAPVHKSSTKRRSFSLCQKLHQLSCLIVIGYIHFLLCSLTCLTYRRCLSFEMSFLSSAVLSWLCWSLVSVATVIVLLKFVIGRTEPGNYEINSYYYLQKLWLRKTIIASFHYSFEIFSLFNLSSPFVLRWLGAYVEDDVKIGELREILYFPSNLLTCKHGVITFSAVMLSPFEITNDGLCCVENIHLGANTNIGNASTILPGAHVAPDSIIGASSLIARETRSTSAGSVLLGIPGREMPFAILNNSTSTNEQSSSDPSFLSCFSWTCVLFIISKYLLFSYYYFLPLYLAPLMQAMFYYMIHRYSNLHQRTSGTFVYSEVITNAQELFDMVMSDFNIFIAPFISRTQYLVILYRALGAQIGQGVLLSDITCLTDPQLVTIQDYVRLNTGASIQVKRQHRISVDA